MINDLKELEKLLKLCRKQGVTKIRLADVELEIGDLPTPNSAVQEVEINPDDPWAKFPPGVLTEEQLMFYSSGGSPEDDSSKGQPS